MCETFELPAIPLEQIATHQMQLCHLRLFYKFLHETLCVASSLLPRSLSTYRGINIRANRLNANARVASLVAFSV